MKGGSGLASQSYLFAKKETAEEDPCSQTKLGQEHRCFEFPFVGLADATYSSYWLQPVDLRYGISC